MQKFSFHCLLILAMSSTALADNTNLASTNATTAVASSNTTPIASSNTAPIASSNTTPIASSNTAPIASSSNTAAIASGSSIAPTTTSGPKPKFVIQYCPTADQLVKDPNALTWSAPGGWQSYQQSFSMAVGEFVGIQWAGIKVGQVICSYLGKEKNSFPIQLVYNKLVFQPSGGKWGQNMGSYINCISNEIKDCPFPVKISQPTNVYEEAAEIKPTPPQEQAF